MLGLYHVRSVRKMCNCNGVLCDLPHSTVRAPSIPPHPTNVLYDGDVVTLGASHLWRIGHVGKEVVSILVVIGSLRLSRHLHSKRAELAGEEVQKQEAQHHLGQKILACQDVLNLTGRDSTNTHKQMQSCVNRRLQT